ncbi:magnesium/cobalt transporter CorA [uncultured Bacteroides sp.]|uniref:magnesium/cobalt transporter CorA n=1 Tax=uncultured Bacteroides sp. TaxID=162156 RepID=UPI002634328E|nr:magnesium/cobalt transporter CorA [uncultured Bacteroides sp.]
MTKNNLLSEQLNYNGASRTPTHLHLCCYNANDVSRYKADTIEELDQSLRNDCINWLQVHGLQNAASVRQVCERFNIDFLTTQDILNSNHLTKIEEHESYNVVILKLFTRNAEQDYEPQQLCIIEGENFLITFTEQETDIFNDIHSAIDNNVLKIRNRQTDYLLSVILNSSMANFTSILSTMEDELEDMEERFLSPDPDDDPGIDDIQAYRRNYRLIRKNILPLKEQFGKLFRAENNLLHKANRPFFNDVNDHLQFALQTLESCRDMLTALVDLYLSNNDRRMNNIMKQLTMVSTIFIPLTFLAGIWGMNFQHMPELSWKYGYLCAWILMIILAVAVYYYFKHKKWY